MERKPKKRMLRECRQPEAMGEQGRGKVDQRQIQRGRRSGADRFRGRRCEVGEGESGGRGAGGRPQPEEIQKTHLRLVAFLGVGEDVISGQAVVHEGLGLRVSARTAGRRTRRAAAWTKVGKTRRAG